MGTRESEVISDVCHEHGCGGGGNTPFPDSDLVFSIENSHADSNASLAVVQYLQCARLYISNVILKAIHEVVQMRKHIM